MDVDDTPRLGSGRNDRSRWQPLTQDEVEEFEMLGDDAAEKRLGLRRAAPRMSHRNRRDGSNRNDSRKDSRAALSRAPAPGSTRSRGSKTPSGAKSMGARFPPVARDPRQRPTPRLCRRHLTTLLQSFARHPQASKLLDQRLSRCSARIARGAI